MGTGPSLATLFHSCSPDVVSGINKAGCQEITGCSVARALLEGSKKSPMDLSGGATCKLVAAAAPPVVKIQHGDCQPQWIRQEEQDVKLQRQYLQWPGANTNPVPFPQTTDPSQHCQETPCSPWR
mmetsp:Transcript_134247/g.267924  ORF Transcript_134247/g.267924 Transcript_134247/m.267924 type:complete len:125 (-) Transcript_134247:549-923(-)